MLARQRIWERSFALGETVTVPYGTFTDCLKTRDYTPLEPGVDEYKYYCPEVRGVVLEVVVEDGERVELVDVNADEAALAQLTHPRHTVRQTSLKRTPTDCTNACPGTVTDVALEKKSGKITYWSSGCRLWAGD